MSNKSPTKLPLHTKDSLSLAQARRIALAAQGFGAKRGDRIAGWARMQKTVERMGLLQLDSVNVLVRSHYLPLFSRLGAYDTAALDRKAFQPRRRALFEYWAHEASLLPLELQPLLRWRMARAARGQGIYKSYVDFAREQTGYIRQVLAELGARGPISVRELSDPGKRGKEMWARHKGKMALEYLFWTGQVTAAGRRNFERVYDLPERALPSAILDRPTPPESEALRALVLRAGRALGVATESDLRDYFRLPVAATKHALSELLEAGDLLPVTVEGWRQPAYLDPAARLPGKLRGTALLTPFDPLVWERARTERLFGFHYRIEIYTPAEKRRHGYYVLPFLVDEALVARVDLKADRAAGLLRVQAAHKEDGLAPEAIAEPLAAELGRLACWLGLEGVKAGWRGDLASALGRSLRTVT
ncbi:MAG: winged helix-turn-helix domain-containing protein [Kiloniellales bacterium]